MRCELCTDRRQAEVEIPVLQGLQANTCRICAEKQRERLQVMVEKIDDALNGMRMNADERG